MAEVDGYKSWFTILTHEEMKAFLVANLEKNDMKVFWLINRLGKGCQNDWAVIRKCDFQIVGISPTHIDEVIDRLMMGEVINFKTPNLYQINPSWWVNQIDIHPDQVLRLNAAIHRNLKKIGSPQGNTRLPFDGVEIIPPENEEPSTEWSMGYNNSPIDPSLSYPKDSIKNKKNIPDIKGIFRGKNLISKPTNNSSINEAQYQALELYRRIEPDNIKSFPFYLWAVKMVGFHILCQFASEIEQDGLLERESWGKVFNFKVKRYLNQKSNGEGA